MSTLQYASGINIPQFGPMMLIPKEQKEERKITSAIHFQPQDDKLEKGPDRISPITDWKE